MESGGDERTRGGAEGMHVNGGFGSGEVRG